MMAEKIGEIELDLNRDQLYGWEPDKCAGLVSEYINRNLGGDIPPQVDVMREKNGTYQLVVGAEYPGDNDERYGGHSRSIATYVSGGVLRCDLWDNHRRVYFPLPIFVPIKDIKLVGYNTPKVINRLRNFPEDVRSRFIHQCGGNWFSHRIFRLKVKYEL